MTEILRVLVQPGAQDGGDGIFKLVLGSAILVGIGEDAAVSRGGREGITSTVPFKQQVQDLLGGGEGSVGTQEDGDVGEVAALEGGHQVLHQLLQRASLHGPHLASLIKVQGRLILIPEPALALVGSVVQLHLAQGDGVDDSVDQLLTDLLRGALPGTLAGWMPSPWL